MKVLRGYVGDPRANADWMSSAMSIVDNKKFDKLGQRGARPFQLATLRLQNMQQILTKWNKLAPPDKELITQQGGTLVFRGKDVVFKYKDKVRIQASSLLWNLSSKGVEIISKNQNAAKIERGCSEPAMSMVFFLFVLGALVGADRVEERASPKVLKASSGVELAKQNSSLVLLCVDYGTYAPPRCARFFPVRVSWSTPMSWRC